MYVCVCVTGGGGGEEWRGRSGEQTKKNSTTLKLRRIHKVAYEPPPTFAMSTLDKKAVGFT